MTQSLIQRFYWLAGFLVIAAVLMSPSQAIARADSQTVSKAPTIVASIKPVQLIVEAVAAGVAPVDVLLQPGASPHSHSLKPSDARKLYAADIVFWVGPDMEGFLGKMLTGYKTTISVPLMVESSLKLRKNNSDDDEHDHENGHDHHHGEYDAHIWLSPNNAAAMAKTVMIKLGKLDPANKQRYKQNYKHFKQSLRAADKRNVARLAKYHSRPMFVFHDAYGYLQAHYKLNIVDHFTINPEQQPGAKHLSIIQEKLEKAGKSCVFREPQFKPAYIDRIINVKNTRVQVLDPLATDITVSPNGYIDFLNGMIDSIIDCFRS